MSSLERLELSALEDMAVRVSDIYAEKFGVTRDATWFLGKLAEELGEVSSAYLKTTQRGRGEASHDDLADELTDLLGFLLLFANWQGIDVETAFSRKWGQYLDEDNERHHT